MVPGSGDTDKVPAMITPGEFVMSKGAVEKYGADTMAIINSTVDGKTICIAKSGSSGATAGQAGMIQAQEDGMYISFSAEL